MHSGFLAQLETQIESGAQHISKCFLTCVSALEISICSHVVCFTVRRVLNTHVGQSLVHKREIGSFVTTLSFTYYYDHQATDGSKTGSQNIIPPLYHSEFPTLLPLCSGCPFWIYQLPDDCSNT